MERVSKQIHAPQFRKQVVLLLERYVELTVPEVAKQVLFSNWEDSNRTPAEVSPIISAKQGRI